MLKHFIYILAFFLLIACKNNSADKNTTGKEANDNSATQDDNAANASTQNYYKRLEGKIAGQDIVLHVSKFEDKLFFNYYYVSKGIPIGLFANPEVKLPGDSIELIEYDRLKRNNNEEEDIKWHIVLTENGLKGKWIDKKGKKAHDINLKESYPAGSHLFNIIGKSGSYPVAFKKDTVAASSYMMIMEPSDATSKNWYNKLFIKNFWGDSTEKLASLSDIINTETNNYFKEYKAEIDTLRMTSDITDTGFHYTLNYENLLSTNAIYNDKDFLVLDVGSYTYSGGAHGLEGTTVICYDMKQKKELMLNDIISIDSASLQKIVEKNFRISAGLKPNEKLTEFLFENKLPANDNFYFTHKGLGFIYQPYEVAAYAMGNIYVFIPYTELKPYLNQQFAQRMGIE